MSAAIAPFDYVDPADFVGRRLTGVAGRHHQFEGGLDENPGPIWVQLDDADWLEMRCLGSGELGFVRGVPEPAIGTGPIDIAPYGGLITLEGSPDALANLVGATIEGIEGILREDPPGHEVGFVALTTAGAIALANLGDDLAVAPWPAEWIDVRLVDGQRPTFPPRHGIDGS